MSILGRVGPLGIALTAGQSALAVRRHWQSFPPEQRARLQELLKVSGGRPARLSESERRELGELVRALELGGLGRDLAMNAVLPRRGFGRRRP
ncbi:MAG: hypothetical protein NVSMB25_18440 [Thermoleophilaceae bacterium]